MGKTADLKKIIKSRLDTLTGTTHYNHAPDNTATPYKVFSFRNVDLSTNRDDIMLQVDIWDYGAEQKRIEEIADSMEKLFDNTNLPQSDILPTFFRESRLAVPEEDTKKQHIQLTFYIQNYEI